MNKVIPDILGESDILLLYNVTFRNLKDLTHGSIRKARPDMYNGARLSDLGKQVQRQLSE